MRLIDADALDERKFPPRGVVHCYAKGWNDAIKAIQENAPTIEVVEVARCKDCAKGEPTVGGGYLCSRRAYKWNGLMCGAVEMKADDFCSYGVNKEVRDEAD